MDAEIKRIEQELANIEQMLAMQEQMRQQGTPDHVVGTMWAQVSE